MILLYQLRKFDVRCSVNSDRLVADCAGLKGIGSCRSHQLLSLQIPEYKKTFIVRL